MKSIPFAIQVLLFAFHFVVPIVSAQHPREPLFGRWSLRVVQVESSQEVIPVNDGALTLTIQKGELEIEQLGAQNLTTKWFSDTATGSQPKLLVTPTSIGSDGIHDPFGEERGEYVGFDFFAGNPYWHEIPFKVADNKLFWIVSNKNRVFSNRLIDAPDEERIVLVFERNATKNLIGTWRAVSVKPRTGVIGLARLPEFFVEFFEDRVILSTPRTVMSLHATIDHASHGLRLFDSSGPILPIPVNSDGQIEVDLSSVMGQSRSESPVFYYEKVTDKER